MIKNKKGILILVISLVATYLLINIIYLIPSGKKYSNTVFLGSSTKVNVKGNTIKVYNEDRKLSKQKAKVYFKKKFVDGYILSEKTDSSNGSNVIYATNEKNHNIVTSGVFIVHTPDISIKIKDTDPYESKDLTDIYELAKVNNIAIGDYFDLDYQEITNVDIDADGKDEYIYSVGLIKSSGVAEEDGETLEDTYDSFVFVKKDNEYFLIDRAESDGDSVTYIKLSFEKLIDFNNDDDYEFVIEKMMSEYGPYNYELYNFNGKEFTKLGGE